MIEKSAATHTTPLALGFKRGLLPVLATTLLLAGIPATRAHAATSNCAARVDEALLTTLGTQAPTLRRDVLRLALGASTCAAEKGRVPRRDLLTVIDYSLPSTDPRLWVFDLRSKKLLFQEHVAHGVNSGQNRTTQFSNIEGSRQTSIGLYVTDQTYVGRNGYSLRLRGLDEGYNDQAMRRAIVMHGASYVNPAAARSTGRLGRSWGCPAVRTAVAKPMIDTLKGGSPIFAYYPDEGWLTGSTFLPR